MADWKQINGGNKHPFADDFSANPDKSCSKWKKLMEIDRLIPSKGGSDSGDSSDTETSKENPLRKKKGRVVQLYKHKKA